MISSTYDTISDDDLLLLFVGGDERAFEEIYRRYWLALCNYSFRRVKDLEVCQDIVQNIFTEVYTRRERLDINNLAAYLHSAVRFQVYKVLSKQTVDDPFYEEFEKILHSPFLADNLVIEKEQLGLLEKWVQALPKKRRAIFLMHYNENLAVQEIAEKLGISTKTVLNQLLRASDYLREQFHHLFAISVIIRFFTH